MIKLIFDLEVTDDWPPVSAESLWLEDSETGYQVKNIPFFLEDIAYNDVIEVERLDETRGEISGHVSRSPNSTIWIFVRDRSIEEQLVSDLTDAAIRVEGIQTMAYYSLCLPEEVPLVVFDDIVSPLEKAERIAISYGALRHRD